MAMSELEPVTFERLLASIRDVHNQLASHVNRTINTSLTLRNWLIGWHIISFEQKGADRAEYGEYLLPRLAERLKSEGLTRMTDRELRRYRRFCRLYPQIRESLTPELLGTLVEATTEGSVRMTALSELSPLQNRESANPDLALSGDILLTRLTFTHFDELMRVEEPLKRTFYEIECVRGGWSVRELRRQIGSLYFERSGLSDNKMMLAQMVHSRAEQAPDRVPIRDPYILEFLGLSASEVLEEDDLEAAILRNLQRFLLEMGHGFCFEARQKRIVIGDRYYFIDLVFYHRVLKCHILIELKIDEFRHEHLGQLNTYVNWFKAHEMTEGDRAPVGLLLCAEKDHALVEYAIAGLDNQLFVSQYKLGLPSKHELEAFLLRQLREIAPKSE